MPTAIPVPVEFRLPEGWTSAPPDEVGAPGVAFVAIHPPADNGFTANITISGGYQASDSTLETVANESVQRLDETSQRVTVAERTEVGSPEAPGLTQLLQVRAVVDGSTRDLIQSQVYLSLIDVNAPQQRFVLQVVLTSTSEQFGDVLNDFQQFVSTVRPKNNDVDTDIQGE